MNVLISGAGVAELPTAFWLRRHGFTPTIVERAGSLLTGGYKIDVRGAALDVQHRMGVHDPIVAASTRLLEVMPEATDWYFDVAAQIDLESWASDRVVLVGDAAYCASPMSGQGSSLPPRTAITKRPSRSTSASCVRSSSPISSSASSRRAS